MNTYPPTKNLYIVEQDGKTYFRVKINKAKQGLKIDKTFTDYQQAIEFLNACNNKIGKKQVKTFLEVEDNVKQIISNYIKNPPIKEYLKQYIENYINPKYSHLDEKISADNYKLRQKDSHLSILNKCLNTNFKHSTSNDNYELSELIFKDSERTVLADLKPIDISTEDVNNLIISLRNKKLTPSTISTYISKMSVFWRKLPLLDKALKNIGNPFLTYDKDLINNGNKRYRKKPFRFDIEKLKSVAKIIRNHKPKANDNSKDFKNIIHLMYKLGLRRQEAILLEKNQIYDNPPHIFIQSKNNERIVYLNDRQFRFVKSLIKPKEERLFKYKVMGFDGSFIKSFKDTGIDQHSFRKDYISRMVEKIGISNSILLAEVLGFTTPRAIEKLKGVFPENNEISTQKELLNQIGHSSSRITAEFYYSRK